MPTDDYADLPDWIRPAEYRFDRKPVPAIPPYRPEPEYRRRGTHFGCLVQRSHPNVVAERIHRLAESAVYEVTEAQRIYGNPKAAGDDRPRAERAMDLLDAIENAARTARRKIERLTDPGGMVAAEYAQDLETS